MRHYFYGFPVSVMKEFFATCPKGLENLLADELTTLGAEQVRETAAKLRKPATPTRILTTSTVRSAAAIF